MKTNFKLFLSEAEEQGSSLSRIITSIEKQMPKFLGSKCYRFGGKDGVEDGKTGPSYLYFFGSGNDKAFRVRTKAGGIVGFDIWKTYHLDGLADFTIDTSGMSVMAIVRELKQIAALVKSPKEGKIEIGSVSEALGISYGTDVDLMEAKSVSAEQFLVLAKKKHTDGELANLSFDQIVAISKENNVAVPNKAWLDGQKVGRGKWTLFPKNGTDKKDDGDKDSKEDDKEPTSSPKGKDPILFIKVTAQDPVSKKFISAGTNEQAQALYKKIGDAINPNTIPSKEELRDVDSLYGDLYSLVSLACKNKIKSLLIYGGPGTGKTYTIMKAIQDAGLVKSKDYVKLSGKASAIEIYKTLFMFRDGGLVLFDDLDTMWKDKEAANYLKAALDTSPVREISSLSSRMQNVSKMSERDREDYNRRFDKFLAGEDADELVDDDDDTESEDDDSGDKPKKKKVVADEKMKFPSTFDFKGRVVFISNLMKSEFDSAILSRSAKIDMSLTSEEILKRMRSILPTLGGTDVSIEDKEKLLEVLLKLHGEKVLDMVTMREFIKGIDIVRSGAPNWPDLIRYA